MGNTYVPAYCSYVPYVVQFKKFVGQGFFDIVGLHASADVKIILVQQSWEAGQ
jgi:hypothetical protein